MGVVKTCSIKPCSRPTLARGWCSMHYSRNRRQGSPFITTLPRHGHSSGSSRGKASPEYAAWWAMKQRCYYPRAASFRWYGGRGIAVCERWRYSFINFLADMGQKPSPHHSLDRIDNGGPYSPENCHWATPTQQRNNKRERAVPMHRDPTSGRFAATHG